MRYFAEIAYRGTHYVGWQIQPNGVSVQQKVNEALRKILRDEEIACVGCGRTDAGVHATQFFLHYDTFAEIPETFMLRMNTVLPDDIVVKSHFPVAENAHARFDATLRAYEYFISFNKDAFGPDRVLWRHFRDLDFDLLQACCEVMKKYNDFPSFCKSKQGSKTTIVNLQEIYWRQEGDTYILFISADRFIRGMVRLVVGAMMQVARGKMTIEEFESGIQKGERLKLALSAPAHGLYLMRVEYPYQFGTLPE